MENNRCMIGEETFLQDDILKKTESIYVPKKRRRKQEVPCKTRANAFAVGLVDSGKENDLIGIVESELDGYEYTSKQLFMDEKKMLKIEKNEHDEGKWKKQKHFKCLECNKSFNHKSNLLVHAFSHSNERKYLCSICNKSFKLKIHLDTHGKVHNNCYEFKCEYCPKEFKFKGNLKTHIMVIHSSNRPFECSKCQKKFKLKQHLLTHIQGAHVETSKECVGFSCNMCDVFKSKGNLKMHSGKKHTNEYLHKCAACEKLFKLKQNLLSHFQGAHMNFNGDCNRFKCHICCQAFKFKGNLNTHMKTKHSNERPHECNLCDKKFKLKQHLSVHVVLKHSKISKQVKAENSC